MINETTIWNSKQNIPELVVQDCRIEFDLTEKECDKLRFILLNRGVNKWLYARRLFIKLKHEVKELFKKEEDKYTKIKLGRINEKMQNIAKLPRWIEWSAKIHKSMKNNEKDIIIKGKHC